MVTALAGGDPVLGRVRPQNSGGPTMNMDNIKKILIYLSLAFVVVSVWRDPAGSADAAGAFLSSVGSFFAAVIDKGSAFLKGLAD